MAQAIFITTDDLKRFTALNGNIDSDKFVQFVKVAQDIHIQNYLGTDLFNKIASDIVASTLSGNYLSLNTNYIKPMLLHYALVEYLPWAAYTISNKGVFKHSAETSETVDSSEVNFLMEKARQTAEHYKQRFVDYMIYNQSSFPEYTSNSNGDMYPDTDSNFTGWVL